MTIEEELNQVLSEMICRYVSTAEVCRASIKEKDWQLEVCV